VREWVVQGEGEHDSRGERKRGGGRGVEGLREDWCMGVVSGMLARGVMAVRGCAGAAVVPHPVIASLLACVDLHDGWLVAVVPWLVCSTPSLLTLCPLTLQHGLGAGRHSTRQICLFSTPCSPSAAPVPLQPTPCSMFCAELGAMVWILFATYLELPVSTTHSISEWQGVGGKGLCCWLNASMYGFCCRWRQLWPSHGLTEQLPLRASPSRTSALVFLVGEGQAKAGRTTICAAQSMQSRVTWY
jgi:hypothetical protein